MAVSDDGDGAGSALDSDGCGSLHNELGVTVVLLAAKKNPNERKQ
jgi:hypothetical protein